MIQQDKIFSTISLNIMWEKKAYPIKPQAKDIIASSTSLLQKRVSVLVQNCLIPKFFSKKKRMAILCKNIIEKKFDIIFLQEALSLSEINILKDKYHFYYKKWILWFKGGLVTLTKQKTDDISFYTYTDQWSFFSGQITDRAIEKWVLVIRYDDVILINTHLVSIYTTNLYGSQNDYNIKQSDQLQDIIREEKKTINRLSWGET